MLKHMSEQEEMRFQYSMMDVKMAIEYHGIHAILDALLADNNYKNDLQNYLTKFAVSDKIVSVD